MLDKNGIILLSMIGPKTYCELQDALNETSIYQNKIVSQTFLNCDEVKSSMRRVFGYVEVSQEFLTLEYSTMLELLKAIKHTGTNAKNGSMPISLGMNKIKSMESAYIKKFGSIRTTCEVFICEAKP
ncbi:MAG: hypothetical protein V1753_11780 [Pseudomonadota bacterium]